MSGAEAIAVLNIISSVIAIIDATKQVHDSASDAKGLPEAFREVAIRLPIVQDILGSAKRNIENGEADEDRCKGAKAVLEACQKKAQKLEELFQKVIPADGASRAKTYLSAVRTVGKGNRVETLMRGILEDLQLHDINQVMATETDTQWKDVAEAIKKLSALRSLPEDATDKTRFHATHSGSGAIYQAQGDQYIIPGSGQVYHAQNMTFGSTDSKNDEDHACLTALFQALRTDPRNDRGNLIGMKGPRTNGTCEGIKSNHLYKLWLNSHSQLLWLSGGPGKGKTMLSTLLADELEQFVKDSPDAVFLEYFCDNKDDKRNTAHSIVRGLLFQLLQVRPKLFNHILPVFKIQRDSLFTDSSLETLWRIFKNSICDPVAGTVYCVIDGLDECDEISSEALLKRFRTLFSSNPSNSSSCLKLAVVSRAFPDFIPEILAGFPRIRLDSDEDNEVKRDIHRFIEVEVDKLSSYKKYPESLLVKVKETLQVRAQGTFLWVGIVAKRLWRYKVTEVEKALDLFPPGLEELYARMLLQIDINQCRIAAKILRWVVMAVRPLTLSELSAAIEPAITKPLNFSLEEVMMDQVSYCGYFLTIKEREVRLIHPSAKDYLLRCAPDPNPELEAFRVEKKAANLEIAKRCIDYLHQGSLAAGKVHLTKDTSHLDTFPLLSYAVLHWPEHARTLPRSDEIFDLSNPFYKKKSQIRESWLDTYHTSGQGLLLNSAELLHIAAYFGILPLAENMLLRKGFINKVKHILYINRKDSEEMSPLAWASRAGHVAIARLLLLKGAHIEAKDGLGRTAIHLAAEGGNESVIQLLLDEGANIKAKDINGWTVLHRAVVLGKEAILRLLLERGVEIEAKDNLGRTGLYRAASLGNDAIVRFLLEKGADIAAKDNNGDTALHRAALSGNEAMVRLLLDKGADIEARDKNGRTAQDLAATRKQEAVVRILNSPSINI